MSRQWRISLTVKQAISGTSETTGAGQGWVPSLPHPLKHYPSIHLSQLAGSSSSSSSTGLPMHLNQFLNLSRYTQRSRAGVKQSSAQPILQTCEAVNPFASHAATSRLELTLCKACKSMTHLLSTKCAESRKAFQTKIKSNQKEITYHCKGGMLLLWVAWWNNSNRPTLTKFQHVDLGKMTQSNPPPQLVRSSCPYKPLHTEIQLGGAKNISERAPFAVKRSKWKI